MDQETEERKNKLESSMQEKAVAKTEEASSEEKSQEELASSQKAEEDASRLQEQRIEYLHNEGFFRLNVLSHMARHNELLEKQNQLLVDLANKLLAKGSPGRPKKGTSTEE